MKEYSSGNFTYIPSDERLLTAELESNESLSRLLNAQIGNDWPPGEYDRNAIEYFLEQHKLKGSQSEGWFGWYVLAETEESKRELIAAAGYFGPPDEEGSVEIGYSIVESRRGKGAATEIVGFLVKNAFQDPRVLVIKARTTSDNPGSIKVLERNRFLLERKEEHSGTLSFILKKY